jgi:hypothetical protein
MPVLVLDKAGRVKINFVSSMQAKDKRSDKWLRIP